LGADRFDKTDDSIIELMVYDPLDGDRGLALIQLSGYHAGHTWVVLPEESCPSGHRGISTPWLLRNWRKWVHKSNPKTDVVLRSRRFTVRRQIADKKTKR
jgi:hypothetical protein